MWTVTFFGSSHRENKCLEMIDTGIRSIRYMVELVQNLSDNEVHINIR